MVCTPPLDQKVTINRIGTMFNPPQIPPPPAPVRNQFAPALTLTRRSARSADSEWSQPSRPTCSSHTEVERLTRQMEMAFAERERQIAESEARLAERARDLDEMEALLRARESLIAATRSRDSSNRLDITPREAEALNKLKEELERQEASLRESREALRERELYLEQSENRLFTKVQEQQEKESELEQREENLVARAINDETSAGGLVAASVPARGFDEFRE